MRRIFDSLKPGGLVLVEDNEGSLHGKRQTNPS
jgi:predicted methyltransferase